MDPELKKLLEDQNKAFADFKVENDKRLAQVEKTGTANATTAANVEALNKRLDEIGAAIKAAEKSAQDRGDEIEKKLNRTALGGGGGGGEDADAKVAAQFAKQRGLKAYTAEDVRNYRAALDTYFRRGNATPVEVMNTLAAGSDPDGGYWVMPDTTGRVVQKIYESSPMRSLADVQTIGTDALEGMIDNGEASSGWVSEQGTRPVTNTPQLGKWRIPVSEQYAAPQATQTLLDDANFNVETWLETKVADKLARTENTAFVSGNGSGKPRGFLDRTIVSTADGSRTWGQLQYVATGASGAFDATVKGDCLLDLVYALKSFYRQGATWFMARASVGAVRKLKDGQGNYLWVPGSATQPATLHGYPVAEGEDMPVIAANSYSIAFGNFKIGYQIVDRMGMRVLRDPYTSKPYVIFYTTKRVGGDVVNSEAIKLLKFAAS